MENQSVNYGTPSGGSGVFTNLEVDHQTQEHLMGAAKWGRFLAIVAMILLGLLLVFSLFAATTFSRLTGGMPGAEFGGVGILITMLIAIGIYVYPVYALLQFGSLTKAGIMQRNQASLNRGLMFLKTMYRYVGILMIVVLSIYGLVFIVALLGNM